MARTPDTSAEESSDETPQAKAKAAARKAARAAAIAETYSTGGSPDALIPESPVPAQSGTGSEELKLRDLIEGAAATGEVKKSDAKAAIRAALAVLGEALAEGRDVNLPGLGKVKTKRSKVTKGRRVSELRLRQNVEEKDTAPAANERVAEEDEEG